MLASLAATPRGDPIEPRAILSYGVLVGAWTLVSIAFLTTSFSYDGSLTNGYISLAVILACAMALRYLSLPRIAGTIEAISLKIGISAAASLGSTMLAATALPLQDTRLSRWDAAFGFHWLPVSRWLLGHPWLTGILHWAYPTLTYQMFLIIPALFIQRKDRRVWTFIFAWGLALACSLAIFPFFPAYGPGPVNHFAYPGHDIVSIHNAEVLIGARDGTIRLLGASTVRGLLTFPSFHVSGAILLAWAAWDLRYLRWPFLVVNVLMIISAVPIVGHYLVDVFGGAAIAPVAIMASEKLTGVVGRRYASSVHSEHPAAAEDQATGVAV